MSSEQTAYIAIGSNLGDPVAQAGAALAALAQLPGSRLRAHSPLYRTAPMGPQDQPDYINAVCALETRLAPLALLEQLQAIELACGRVRHKDNRWGPRTLDLDILLYGEQQIDLPTLTVPHYGMRERPFVLWPLADIAPGLHLPDGTPLQQLLDANPAGQLQVLPGSRVNQQLETEL